MDESIGTVSLPQIEPGENLLTLKIPFGRRTSVEACYLLGDFNVRLEGCEKTLVPATSQIGFSDITSQGLPFYGGNVTYSTEIETGACDLRIHATKFRGSLIRVEVDGTSAGVIAYSPYTVEARGLTPGKHTITFKLFGNRYNTFAGLHNAHAKTTPWAGPDFWRTKDDAWCYEYLLDETGILKSPVIEVFEQ